MVNVTITILILSVLTMLILLAVLDAKLKATSDLIVRQGEYIQNIEREAYDRYMEHRELIEDLGYKTEQNIKDIKAISDAVTIFSRGIGTETVEAKVKENIDLFGEWINGAE